MIQQTPLILIVDDDMALQRATVYLMKKAGYNTCVADDGISGLQIAREQKPDIVLLDVKLPDISGLDICKFIKEDPTLVNTFVILVSGVFIDWQNRMEGIQGGADAYITRPVANEEILVRVQGLLRIQQAEKALRENEERYRTMIESSPEAITIIRDEKLFYCNPAMVRLLGASSPQQLVGTLIYDFAPPDEREIASEIIKKITCGTSFIDTGTERILRKLDGTIIIVEMRAVSMIFEGQPAIQSNLHDITERKRAEKQRQTTDEMQAAYQYARSLIEASLDPLVTISPAGKITDVNLATEEATGVPRQDLIGTDFADYFTEPDRARAEYQQVFESGYVIDYPLTLRHTSSKTIDVLYNARIYRAKDGKVLGVFAAARDITQRKQAEQRLLEYQRLLAETEAIGTVGGWEIDIETMQLIWTDEVYRIHEVDKPFHPTVDQGIQYYTPASQPLIARAVQRAIELGEPFDLDLEIITAKGNQRWVHTIGKADLLQRKVRGFFQDISARKQAELELINAHALLEQRVQERTAQLQAANENLEKAAHMKDEFLASMSHELRTPLTGILGLSEALQLPSYGPLNEKQTKAVYHIHQSGRHLLEMINEILDLAKVGAGKMELNPTRFPLEKICQESLEINATQAAAKQLHYGFSSTPQSIILIADARRIKQILVNLIANAVKFTPTGGSFGIEVNACAAEKQIHITVWDTGIGIKAEDLQHIFQSFVQLDARLARKYSGTGLGLVMVKRLTELHGGSVTVQSTFGQGSRFTVTLPWQN